MSTERKLVLAAVGILAVAAAVAVGVTLTAEEPDDRGRRTYRRKPI